MVLDQRPSKHVHGTHFDHYFLWIGGIDYSEGLCDHHIHVTVQDAKVYMHAKFRDAPGGHVLVTLEELESTTGPLLRGVQLRNQKGIPEDLRDMFDLLRDVFRSVGLLQSHY